MIVIVIGSGAREHAICRLINKSEFSEKLTCIPGNYGISKIAKCINLDNSEDQTLVINIFSFGIQFE